MLLAVPWADFLLAAVATEPVRPPRASTRRLRTGCEGAVLNGHALPTLPDLGADAKAQEGSRPARCVERLSSLERHPRLKAHALQLGDPECIGAANVGRVPRRGARSLSLFVASSARTPDLPSFRN